jgi:Sec7-like guanine-nucleotide exchange factor
LITEKIINDNPKDIGTFLFVCDKFDKVQLGEYLSRGVANNNVDDTATEILNIFVSHFNFEHMDFDLALRFVFLKF